MVGRLPPPRTAALRNVSIDGEVIDQALILLFESRKSFTDQEVAEIHLHGGPAIVAAVLRYLGDVPGLRMAEPGEFSRRALENGRLDLAQIEGLGDLIEAETDAQRRQAMRVFSGVLGERIAEWRQSLITVSALLAAGIDFADEDISEDHSGVMLKLVDSVLTEFRTEIAGSAVAERIRDGFEVAIVGKPNTGKSTLLNAIVGRPAALTSARAGTTRDVIEVKLDLDGFAVTLLDTAGLRASNDDVEILGIARARERAAAADLRIILTEDGEAPDDIVVEPDDLIVLAKADLRPGDGLRASGLTGAGVDRVLERVGEVLGFRAGGAALITRERHRKAIEQAEVHVGLARDEITSGLDRSELAAEHIRAAVQALDVVIGRIDVEDVLGEIFSRFCIGK
jgi:tRNA modification GTPase